MKGKNEFEFCKVCKLNHDHGKRHKYLPHHTKSLAALLDRFRSKIEDVRFFLKNPSVLRLHVASGNRFWCVFCEEDVVELGSSVACDKAIQHLASANHLKNTKHFMWKYVAGKDQVDTYRILESDVAKWEKKCQSLKSEAASSGEGSNEMLYGPSNDIHTEFEFKNIYNFESSIVHPLNSNYTNGVMPLQCNTNEYQICHSGVSEVTNTSSTEKGVKSSLPRDMHSGNNPCQKTLLHMSSGRQDCREVCQDERRGIFNGSFLGLQSIARVSSSDSAEVGGNVHSGAPPPWLDASNENLINHQLSSLISSTYDGSANKSVKSNKLNPKRVGAAWAEKRKMEMEMEKKGVVMKTDCDSSWLPNFGRVWQSGSRKESRKEFESQKPKLLEKKRSFEMPTEIQPYVSKRMRRDATGE